MNLFKKKYKGVEYRLCRGVEYKLMITKGKEVRGELGLWEQQMQITIYKAERPYYVAQGTIFNMF